MLAGLAATLTLPAAGQTCQSEDRQQTEEGRLFENTEAGRLFKRAMVSILDARGADPARRHELWQAAAEAIQGALDSYPQSLSRDTFVTGDGRFGRRFYFPHYYLGLCRYHLGDCTGALDAFLEAELGGCVLLNSHKRMELNAKKDECRASSPPDRAILDSEAVPGNGPAALFSTLRTQGAPPLCEARP